MPTVVQADDQSQFNTLPPGDWTPDIPSPTNQGLVDVLNVVPKANGLYGPEGSATSSETPSVTPFGNAIKVIGQLHSKPPVPGGKARFYVGTFATASGDSRIVSQEENEVWEDLSKAGGYTVTVFKRWTFANFGTKVFAANRGIRTQVSQGGSNAFADVTDAPQFDYIDEVAGFIVGVLAIDNAHGEGTQNYRVWWSAIGNGESFPDPTSDTAINTQSGFQDLFGGGTLRAVISGVGGHDAVIIADRRVWRMTYVGFPQIFRFDEIANDQGTVMPGSIAKFNTTLFFFGQNGFYWFDGQSFHPIGNGKVDDFFIGDLSHSANFGFQTAISAAVDTLNKNYVIAYRNASAGGDNNNRILRFNWVTGNWSKSAHAFDAIGNLDNQESNTDAPRFYGIGSDFIVKTATGSSLEATIETSEVFHEDGARARIKSVMPLIDSANVTSVIQTRDRLDRSQTASASRGWSNHGTMRYDDVKVTGRFYNCKMTVPASESWNNYQGIQYEWTPWSYGPRIPPA